MDDNPIASSQPSASESHSPLPDHGLSKAQGVGGKLTADSETHAETPLRDKPWGVVGNDPGKVLTVTWYVCSPSLCMLVTCTWWQYFARLARNRCSHTLHVPPSRSQHLLVQKAHTALFGLVALAGVGHSYWYYLGAWISMRECRAAVLGHICWGSNCCTCAPLQVTRGCQ